MNIPGSFVVFFKIISLASEERIPKQLKQVSIVSKNKVFYPEGGCGGQKILTLANSLLQALVPFWRLPPFEMIWPTF